MLFCCIENWIVGTRWDSGLQIYYELSKVERKTSSWPGTIGSHDLFNLTPKRRFTAVQHQIEVLDGGD